MHKVLYRIQTLNLIREQHIAKHCKPGPFSRHFFIRRGKQREKKGEQVGKKVKRMERTGWKIINCFITTIAYIKAYMLIWLLQPSTYVCNNRHTNVGKVIQLASLVLPKSV